MIYIMTIDDLSTKKFQAIQFYFVAGSLITTIFNCGQAIECICYLLTFHSLGHTTLSEVATKNSMYS